MAKLALKPLRDQVIVITGATSGIGLATARMAAERGATLMLLARNEEALKTLRGELRSKGTRVDYAVADVGDLAAVEAAAEKTIATFGGFDSWVNNAGAALFGRLEDTAIEDQRRAFDTLYWGVVHGTLVAGRHLKTRGGKIVNVGSVLSDRTVALQATYCAAKHAVKGVTDGFRMEFEEAGYPIGVTLIKPSSIDTLFPEHARNLTGAPGTRLPPPQYHPRVVGRAILHACTHEARTLVVGMGGYAISLLGNHAPRLTDYIMEAVARRSQTTEETGQADRRDNLYEPRADLSETSSLSGPPPRRTSLLLEAQMNPLGTTGLLVGLGAVILGAAIGVQGRRNAAERRIGRATQRQALSAAQYARQTALDLADRARSQGSRLLHDAGDLAQHGSRGLLREARSLARDARREARRWL
ncbi:SDR family oxidoreductase [Roseomonas sp. BN140053]|uniref:SDR family oxidoreductase n=1 Tax=Roseomonas sp. BN140053 TaxID=3391898 RepID=UPI0039E9AB0B